MPGPISSGGLASPAVPEVERAARAHGGVVALAFGALGIVYGDIGTSPLYAFRESFEHADLDVTPGERLRRRVDRVLGAGHHHLDQVPRARDARRQPRRGRDPRPHGAACCRSAACRPARERAIIALGVFGTALLYGDGLITPAISVLSAVEGFEVATTAFESWVIPVAVTILVVLFLVQRRGTERISRVFGPGDDRVVRRDRRPRAAPDRRPPECAARHLARRTAVELFIEPAGQGVPGARLDLPRRHRRRGAVRRHGSLRPASDPGVVVRARAAGAAAQLLRSSGAARRAPRRGGRPTVLPAGPGVGGHPVGRAGDDGHRHRLAGADHRRLLAHRPGDAARLPAAPRGPPHLVARTSDRSTCRSSTGC